MDKSLLWKLVLGLGIILSFIAFILGWVSFGVADWHSFRRYNGSIVEYYGLWAYCQDQTPTLNSVCKRWPSASDQLFNGTVPNFIRTSDGLFTTGMILLSLGLIAAFMTLIVPFIAFLAFLLAFLTFIFLVVGLPIFGRQSNDFSAIRGDFSYDKRYGFWLMVPTIILEFFAGLLFLGAGVLYKMFGFGNVASKSVEKSTKTFQASQNILYPVSSVPPPFSYPSPTPSYGSLPLVDKKKSQPVSNLPPVANHGLSNLLSEYLNQRLASPYGNASILTPTLPGTTLPAPSVTQVLASSLNSNVIPTYVRSESPLISIEQPIFNSNGQTVIGPIMSNV